MKSPASIIIVSAIKKMIGGKNNDILE